jgi:hypothetical protein
MATADRLSDPAGLQHDDSPEPILSTRRIGRIAAADLARDPRNGRDDTVHVMAANYDPDGEPGEWDGISAEDVITWTRDDGSIDLDGFEQWGPFEVWYAGPYAPIARDVPTTTEWAETVKAAREADALASAAYSAAGTGDYNTGRTVPAEDVITAVLEATAVRSTLSTTTAARILTALEREGYLVLDSCARCHEDPRAHWCADLEETFN